MMLAGFLFLLLLRDGLSSERNCSYHDVLKHLNFTENKDLHSLIRPVKNHKEPTVVHMDVLLYAILDVNEKEQQVVPYVWINMWWKSDYIAWDPADFCGIRKFSLPTELLWKPDLTIEEMTEKDKAPPSPYLTVNSRGEVEVMNDQVLVSTCGMHVYKFPFDIQSCNISFKSVVHSVEEIHLVQYLNSSEATESSRELMRTQYEWLFINMTVTNKTVETFGFKQDVMIYTISIRRRSALYIANFMLPVLFFLCLDLASFLISDSGGEKLSFKVTVLLAVTVLQLILNEILPSSSDKIPLIATYCIGIFGLMLLSLLETILVMHLMEKDSQDDEADKDQSLSEDCNKQSKANFHKYDAEMKKWTLCDVSTGETPSELLSEAKEGSSSKLTEECHDSEKLSDDLREVLKTLIVLLNSKKEEGKPGYWARVTKRINKAFFIFYVIAASLFLLCMCISWTYAEE
ncbi:5-hydroxytryptamine receptor 3A-like isoform X1 [Micropterus dolomieu]|uniref:5-hydroxytryptamine receptor 3A-like isoform X1 n=1 Tax=Micropterus dolomieu TaxID=147949 RepID=UPI001E8E3C67|nr:5-hydroxytryptamine receptor 3A-like isoform X1 [Micropterus dolomieu]